MVAALTLHPALSSAELLLFLAGLRSMRQTLKYLSTINSRWNGFTETRAGESAEQMQRKYNKDLHWKSDKVPFKWKPIFWVESNSAYPGLCGERLEESKQVISELLLQSQL